MSMEKVMPLFFERLLAKTGCSHSLLFLAMMIQYCRSKMGEESETAESERQPNLSASHRPCARKSTRKFVLDPVPEDVPHSAGPTKNSGVSTNSRYTVFFSVQ